MPRLRCRMEFTRCGGCIQWSRDLLHRTTQIQYQIITTTQRKEAADAKSYGT